MKIEFYAGGIPLPKGSGNILRGRYVESADMATKTRPAGALGRWSGTVAWAAKAAVIKAGFRKFDDLFDGPLTVALVFYVDGAPHKQGTGDIDKLTRAVLDAMEGVVYTNDARVVEIFSEKKREDDGDPGVWVSVKLYEGGS